MDNQNQEREKQIDTIIEQMYHETGIYEYYQELKPDIFEVLVQQLIPKRREQIRCILEREEKKEQLKTWQDKRTKAKKRAKSYASTLRFWETNEPLRIPISVWKFKNTIEINFAYLLNNSFDWLLKIGLTVVPILSLFGIFAISNLKDPLAGGNAIVGFILFISITLVWLTSATIFNLVISWGNQSNRPKNFSNNEDRLPTSNQSKIVETNVSTEQSLNSIMPNNPIGGLFGIIFWVVFGREYSKSDEHENQTINDSHEPEALKVKIGRRKSFQLTILPRSVWIVSIIVFIVIAESVIGFAIIPTLVDIGRKKNQLPLLEWWEKVEILFGISIFSLINVLFAVAKARLYRFNAPRKKRYSALATEWLIAEEMIKNISAEIDKLDQKINQLEKEVFPTYEMEEIKNAILTLSNEVTFGQERQGKNPRTFATKKNKQQGEKQQGNTLGNDSNNNVLHTQNSSNPAIPNPNYEIES